MVNIGLWKGRLFGETNGNKIGSFLCFGITGSIFKEENQVRKKKTLSMRVPTGSNFFFRENKSVGKKGIKRFKVYKAIASAPQPNTKMLFYLCPTKIGECVPGQ